MTNDAAALFALVADVLDVEAKTMTGKTLARVGGSSLDAARIAVAARERLGLHLSAVELVRCEDLAAFIGEQARSGVPVRQHHGDCVFAEGDLVPLTWQQRIIWYYTILRPDSRQYLFYGFFEFDQLPDIQLLKAQLHELLRRHPILRTRLEYQQGEPYQVVPALQPTSGSLDFHVVHLNESIACPERLVGEIAADRSFDLESGPLIRWVLAIRPDHGATLVQAEHHLIHDGRSFHALCRSLSRQQNEHYCDLGYFRYAQAQARADAERKALILELAEQCRAADTGIFTRHSDRSGEDALLRLPLPSGLLKRILLKAKAADVSLFTTMFASFSQAVLHHQGVAAAVVGSAVENRDVDDNDTIGMFVSTIPIVIELQGDRSEQDLIDDMKKRLPAAIARADLPLDEVVSAVGGSASRGESPLIRAAFSMHQQLDEQVTLGGVPAQIRLGAFNGEAKFPLNIVMLVCGRGEAARVEINLEGRAGLVAEDDLWSIWTMMLSWIKNWLEEAGTESNRPESGNSALVDSVRARAASDAAVIALRDQSESFSYSDLIRVAGALSHVAVPVNEVIAVYGQASASFFALAHAVMQAGCTYLPLDPGQPVERLASQCRQAGCRQLLTCPEPAAKSALADLVAAVPDLEVLNGAELIRSARSGSGSWRDRPLSSSPAYVVYTSGSTGSPKGVVVERESLDRLIEWAINELQLAPGSRVGQTANVGFDASVFEVWPALCAGATVVVAPVQIRADPAQIICWLQHERISHVFAPTPIAELLMRQSRYDPMSTLAVLSCGGDKLNYVPEQTSFRILNLYGPTEATSVSTVCQARPETVAASSIGHLLPYAYGRVVGATGAEVGPGERGELWIGGRGLARGYLGDFKLTAAKFVVDPHSSDGERMYRTGDLVERRGDGSLAFFGRRDRQVKISGVRLELGELESQAMTVEGVLSAVAHCEETGDRKRITLLVTVEPGRAADPAIEVEVRAKLPSFVRHIGIRISDQLPLTANGKLDRRMSAIHPPVTRAAGRHER